MKIGRNKQSPEFTLWDLSPKYTDKYNYLGYIQNNKNIAGNKTFNNIEM